MADESQNCIDVILVFLPFFEVDRRILFSHLPLQCWMA
jgi:hypothetical protein